MMKLTATITCFLVCLGGSNVARAETLYEAFASAYRGNPVLAAQRTAVEIGKQDEAIARTGYAPDIAGSADYGYSNVDSRQAGTPSSDAIQHPRGYGVSLSQNIFNGFKTGNAVSREQANLEATRERLRDTEQNILLQVASAYVDVRRDKTIIDLRRSNLEVLLARAKETRLRFKIGDLTQTDIDQSEADLARSQADLLVARSNLDNSVANYRAVVGHDPGVLEPAAVPERLIPRDLDAAVAMAEAEHPLIRAGLDTVLAAEHDIDVQKAGYSPSLDFTATAGHRWDTSNYPNGTETKAVQVMGSLTIPIFDRGLTLASVTRATEVQSQRMLELDQQRLQVRAAVVQNWGTFLTSKQVVASQDVQIAANDRALFGVQLEATVGQRTTLDILTAQRALLDARVNREIELHDRIVSGYKLVASIGRLSLDRLAPTDTRGHEVLPPPTQRDRSHLPPIDIKSLSALPFRGGYQ